MKKSSKSVKSKKKPEKSIVDIEIDNCIKNHDNFNMFTLILIIAADIFYIVKTTELSSFGQAKINSGDENILALILLGGFFVYLLVDAIWIIIEPRCVKAGSLGIVLHHILTIILLPIPLYIPHFRRHLAGAGLLELNTLFLILRRNTIKKSISYHFCHYAFLFTWFILRVIMLPVLTYYLMTEYINFSENIKSFYNYHVVPPVVLAGLTLMSAFWTYDIMLKLINNHNRSHKQDNDNDNDSVMTDKNEIENEKAIVINNNVNVDVSDNYDNNKLKWK